MTPPPAGVRAQLADLGVTALPDSFVRYPGDQRHASWSFAGAHGERYWLKVEVSSAYFAGIANEARLLGALRGRADVPNLVVHSSVGTAPHFLVTEDATEGRVETQPVMATDSAVDAVAVAYARFFACVDAYRFDRPTGHDLLVESPDLNLLLAGPLQGAAAAVWKTLVDDVRAAVRPELVGLVHGSLDRRNVVFGPRGPVLLDLEVCRPGPASFDLAQMCGSLIDDGQTGCALTWLSRCRERLAATWRPVNIAGYLIVRYFNRARAIGVEPAHLAGTVNVVQRLLETDSHGGEIIGPGLVAAPG
jgi:hypothetical protein